MLETATATPAASVSASAFDLSPEQREILDAADRYARQEMHPLARRMDDEEWWPAEAFAQLGAEGYLGISIPPAYGGAGLDLVNTGVTCPACAAASWSARWRSPNRAPAPMPWVRCA